MLENKLSSRSIINRTYYSVFYRVLAIFIKYDINLKTLKYSGVISLFDNEFLNMIEKLIKGENKD